MTTSSAASTVHRAISKRMVEEREMPWTERGAQLLLQVRTQVLNEDLRGAFQRWYPGMTGDPDPVEDAAA